MGHSVVYCPKCDIPIMEGHHDWKCDICGWYMNANTSYIPPPKKEEVK